MRNFLLFLSTLTCWAPTWYLIKFQFGIVDPIVSVFYRFFFSWCNFVYYFNYCKKKYDF